MLPGSLSADRPHIPVVRRTGQLYRGAPEMRPHSTGSENISVAPGLSRQSLRDCVLSSQPRPWRPRVRILDSSACSPLAQGRAEFHPRGTAPHIPWHPVGFTRNFARIDRCPPCNFQASLQSGLRCAHTLNGVTGAGAAEGPSPCSICLRICSQSPRAQMDPAHTPALASDFNALLRLAVRLAYPPEASMQSGPQRRRSSFSPAAPHASAGSAASVRRGRCGS